MLFFFNLRISINIKYSYRFTKFLKNAKKAVFKIEKKNRFTVMSDYHSRTRKYGEIYGVIFVLLFYYPINSYTN